MKTSNAADTIVEREGLASDGTFKIQFNAKMAKILSDGLYSDKIKSIIRELSSNAYDSHTEAGTKVPFEVHLPTVWEPWFYVKDFGVGLDHNQVLEIYTVYGASTKTKSDDYVGQLGLGSKSPFSYVDAFDVLAIKDGVERSYSMYKNEQGMPSVALLGEKPTTDKNGVTVKLPVKTEDFHKFSEKAAAVYKWYDLKPTIVGNSIALEPKLDVVFSGTNWKILRKNNYYSRNTTSESVALMGRVAYPLNAGALGTLTPAELAIMQMPLVLDFKIGDLEVAASREAIGYDPRTQDNIKALIRTVLAELAVDFEKTMASSKTEWEARHQFDKIFGNDNGLKYDLEQAFGKHGLKWKGKVITNNRVTLNTTDLWDAKETPILYSLSPGQKRARQVMNHDTRNYRCAPATVFIFDDLDKGVLSRAHYYHENTGSNEIHIIGPSKLKTIKQIVELLGNPPYKLASSLPKRPSVARVNKINMVMFTGGATKGPKAWEAITRDVSLGGLYVTLDHWDVKRDGKVVTNLLDVVRLARDLKIITNDQMIYAPRGSLKTKLANEPGWTDFWVHVRDKVTALITPATIQDIVDTTHFTNVSANISYDTTLGWKKIKGSRMVEFAEGYKKLSATASNSSKNMNLINLASHIGIPIVKNSTPTVDLDALAKSVKKTYPMLEYVYNGYYGYRSGSIPTKNIVDYVELVDKAANP